MCVTRVPNLTSKVTIAEVPGKKESYGMAEGLEVVIRSYLREGKIAVNATPVLEIFCGVGSRRGVNPVRFPRTKRVASLSPGKLAMRQNNS